MRARGLLRGGRVGFAVLVVSALVSTACTSSRPPAPRDASRSAPKTETTVAPGQPAPPVSADPAQTAAGQPGVVATASRPGGQAPPTPPGQPRTGRAGDPPVPALFSAGDDHVGISDTTVRLCVHYRKYLGRVLDVAEEDLLVHWRSVNERGGIHGRQIEERFAEDGGGRLVAQAYEECRSSLMVRGAPGAEAITPMRRIIEADAHPAPYLHFSARADPAARYSFSLFPSHETLGRLTGQFVVSRFPGARIGVIFKDSDSWDAAHRQFLAALREAGVEVVADVPLSPGDPVVADELAAVRGAGAEVVWAWVEGLDTIQLIKQSNAQRYPMRWVVPYAFNSYIEPLGEDALKPAPVTGLNVSPPATPGYYDGPFAPYAEEYRRFEDAYRRYRGKPPSRNVADLLFLKWLEDRHVASLLEQCGRDCTRNRLVSPLTSGRFTALEPACPFDLSRGRAGGYRVSARLAVPTEAGPIWVETDRCVDRF